MHIYIAPTVTLSTARLAAQAASRHAATQARALSRVATCRAILAGLQARLEAGQLTSEYLVDAAESLRTAHTYARSIGALS